MLLQGDLMLYPPEFCSEHVAGILPVVLQRTCTVHCDLRPYPVCSILLPVVCCASLLEEACKYKGFVEAA